MITHKGLKLKLSVDRISMFDGQITHPFESKITWNSPSSLWINLFDHLLDDTAKSGSS